MTHKFYPLLGDFAVAEELVNQNKFMCYNYKAQSIEKVGDVWLCFFGSDHVFYMHSAQAIQELYDNIPKNIDRGQLMLLFISKLSQNGIEVSPSSENWKERRTTFTKLIGINHSSKYIPIMVSQMQEMKDNLKKEDYIDFSTESSRILFTIISKIIFGKDLSNNIGFMDFTTLDGTIERMAIDKFFVRI